MKDKKLLEQVTDKIRVMGYSYKTEKSYSSWIKRYILYHHKNHQIRHYYLKFREYSTTATK